MIVKILSRHSPSYKSLISYILREDKTIAGNPAVLTHNIKSRDQDGYLREFLENEATRKYPRDGQIYMYHEILSFNKAESKESVSRENLEIIAREYFTQRNIDGMYLASIHEDKDHAHIHVMSSGLKYRTGLANRLSNKELFQLKFGMQEFHKQRFPEISKSNCNHGAGMLYQTDREWHKANRELRNQQKLEFTETVNQALENARTQKEFLENLRTAGLHHYERNGVPAGITYEDQKFRFSRLEIPNEKFKDLPIDRLEEQNALDDIQSIRESKSEYEKEMDIENDDIDNEDYDLDER